MANETKKVGIPPAPQGRPKTVDEAVTDKVVEYCTMLRAWKLQVYHSTVIGHFQQLVSGTELGKKIERPDGSWDVLKLDNWYYRSFVEDHPDISSGLQLPLKVQRGEWGQSSNLDIFYNRTREQLLEVTRTKSNFDTECFTTGP
jgi:hypothetical protein